MRCGTHRCLWGQNQLEEAAQATSTITAGTGLPVLHIKLNYKDWQSLTQHTKELFFLKGETAVKLLCWCRTDRSSQEKKELMVLPLASQHVPEISAMTPPGSIITLNIPQGRQGRKSCLEGVYSSLTCAVPFLSIQSKAIATETPEAANGVSTRPMSAQAREDFTFVHICG